MLLQSSHALWLILILLLQLLFTLPLMIAPPRACSSCHQPRARTGRCGWAAGGASSAGRGGARPLLGQGRWCCLCTDAPMLLRCGAAVMGRVLLLLLLLLESAQVGGSAASSLSLVADSGPYYLAAAHWHPLCTRKWARSCCCPCCRCWCHWLRERHAACTIGGPRTLRAARQGGCSRGGMQRQLRLGL